jgi:D-alanyl-D-alanine carboxypeptidase
VKEVCVAGESPGSAKQKESWGEATVQSDLDSKPPVTGGTDPASDAGRDDPGDAAAGTGAGIAGAGMDAQEDVPEEPGDLAEPEGGGKDASGGGRQRAADRAAEPRAEERNPDTLNDAPPVDVSSGEVTSDDEPGPVEPAADPAGAGVKPVAEVVDPGPEPEGNGLPEAGPEAEREAGEPRENVAAPERGAEPRSEPEGAAARRAGAKQAEGPEKVSKLGGRQSTFVPLKTGEQPVATAPTRLPGPPAPAALAAPPEQVRSDAKQAPLPQTPGEPLKLLAELTNTPPPPQTPLRSVVRRFKIWTPLVLVVLIVFGAVQALRPLPNPKLTLTSQPTYTFSGSKLSPPWPNQGQSAVQVEGLGSMGTNGAMKAVPIASLTKVMTAYVILKDHPLTGTQNGPTITVDATAANESSSADQSIVVIKQGQRFTERQLLQLMLIPSANNVARLLARWDAGSTSAFVKKMMKAAGDLGMTNTTYTGASGVESTTISTAADQLKLAGQVMKNNVFRSIVAIANIDIPGVGRVYNTNNLLVNPGVVGIKTGSSTPAGGALMWAAEQPINGQYQTVLGVVLQQQSSGTVYDSMVLAENNSQKLISAALQGLTSATVVKKGDVVGYVDDGLGGRTPVVATQDLTAIGWPGMTAKMVLTASTSGLPHTAMAGTQVGTLSFGSGSAATQVPVALKSDLAAPSLSSKLARIG